MAILKLAVDDAEVMQEILNKQQNLLDEGYETTITQLAPGKFRGAFEGTRPRGQILLDGPEGTPKNTDVRKKPSIQAAFKVSVDAEHYVGGTGPKGGSFYILVRPSNGMARQRGIVRKPGDLIEIPAGSEIDLVTAKTSMSAFVLRSDVRDSIYRGIARESAPRSYSLVSASAARLDALITRYIRVLRDSTGDKELERLLQNQLVACLLEVNPEQEPRVGTRFSRLAVKRAEAYLGENLDSPIPVHELAEIVGCPLRTLSHGFKAEFGVSPYVFHARMRMQAAHNDLLHQTQDSTSVTDVALAYGFEHLGRFSVSYKRHFGERPWATLRRRSPLWGPPALRL